MAPFLTWPEPNWEVVGPSQTGDLVWRKAVHQSGSVWEAVFAAAQKVDRQQIKKLTDSMNERLTTATEKKGGYFSPWFIYFLSVRNVYLKVLSCLFIILT